MRKRGMIRSREITRLRIRVTTDVNFVKRYRAEVMNLIRQSD